MGSILRMFLALALAAGCLMARAADPATPPRGGSAPGVDGGAPVQTQTQAMENWEREALLQLELLEDLDLFEVLEMMDMLEDLKLLANGGGGK